LSKKRSSLNEDGGRKFLRNVCNYLSTDKATHPTKLYFIVVFDIPFIPLQVPYYTVVAADKYVYRGKKTSCSIKQNFSTNILRIETEKVTRSCPKLATGICSNQTV